MNAIFIICICFLLLINCLFVYKLYKFSIIILTIEESLEESLDILNEKYRKINKILNIPIFFDSIEVRSVVNDIKDCHSAILLVANKLTNDIGIKSEIEEKSSANKIEKVEET